MGDNMEVQGDTSGLDPDQEAAAMSRTSVGMSDLGELRARGLGSLRGNNNTMKWGFEISPLLMMANYQKLLGAVSADLDRRMRELEDMLKSSQSNVMGYQATDEEVASHFRKMAGIEEGSGDAASAAAQAGADQQSADESVKRAQAQAAAQRAISSVPGLGGGGGFQSSGS